MPGGDIYRRGLRRQPEILPVRKRAVFLDRDGTINEDVGYPRNFDQIKIFSWSFEAIRKIRDAGFLAIIITNQSGIGRGYLPKLTSRTSTVK
jgi:D-glycero-D-manno-heptose 1,7-bisphosphate phosphatase